jgi:hypothetical protein
MKSKVKAKIWPLIAIAAAILLYFGALGVERQHQFPGLLDVKFSYSTAEIADFKQSVSTSQSDTYSAWRDVDNWYPLALLVCFATIFVSAIKLGNLSRRFYFLILIPLIGVILDYIENAMFGKMLLGGGEIVNISPLTSAKFGFYYATIVSALTLIIVAFVKFVQNKNVKKEKK